MRITYLFRCPGTGHSIEELFESVRQAVVYQADVQINTMTLPHISRGLGSIWKNSWFIRRLNADVFHITGDVHYAALLLPACRTVLTIHDCILLQKSRKRSLRYAFFWLFWYYLPIRQARTVTTISDKVRRELIQLVGEIAQKVIVVPNGYAPIFTFQPAHFQTRKPILLQIGTAPHKNVHRLLTALKGISCTLIIVGPMSSDLLTELSTYQIEYSHYEVLNQSEIVALYEACDMVTFLSTYEGFGMPIIEANAVGRPVLTSNLEPMKTVAGSAAHVVNPMDVMAIRVGIEQLIRDNAYQQALVEEGRKNAQQYTVASTAKQYICLYRRLMNTGPLS